MDRTVTDRYAAVTKITPNERGALESLAGSSLRPARCFVDGQPHIGLVALTPDGAEGLVAVLIPADSPLSTHVSFSERGGDDWADAAENRAIDAEPDLFVSPRDNDDVDDDVYSDMSSILDYLAGLDGDDDESW